MIAFFLLLVIAAIMLGIVGVVAKGLLYLLIIGIVVFLGALTLAALRIRRRPGKHPARKAPPSTTTWPKSRRYLPEVAAGRPESARSPRPAAWCSRSPASS